jgi:signal transduction histidine kinase
VHDAALDIPDSRVAPVCAAARMALDNERLQARVRAQLSEVRASRARIVAAADDARRDIERDLHDGAQQRLLAVLLQLRRAQARGDHPAGGTTGDATGRTHEDDAERTELAALRAELGRAADELAGALDDVRAIARGLHPPALDHGLAAALETLAESAPLPVELDLHDALPPLEAPLAAATYFGVAEALTNTVRHADATHLAVGVRYRDGVLAVVIADDGRGGAHMERGTGLQHLSDRVAALGGTLGLDSPPGRGTVVRLDLPLAPEPAGGQRVDPVKESLTGGIAP